MFALRDIEEGEELTIDSSKFSEQPYRSDVESVAK
jgi:SET domain-containing protein